MRLWLVIVSESLETSLLIISILNWAAIVIEDSSALVPVEQFLFVLWIESRLLAGLIVSIKS